MGDVTVRRATEADARAIAAIHVATWRAAYAAILPVGFPARLSVQQREAGWRTGLREPAPRVASWVAEADGRVVGFATTGPTRDADVEGFGELYTMYVEPRSWGSGAGSALMERALDGLREAGFESAMLWVFADNPRGRAFYERWGWAPDGCVQDLDIEGQTVQEVRYRIRLQAHS